MSGRGKCSPSKILKDSQDSQRSLFFRKSVDGLTVRNTSPGSLLGFFGWIFEYNPFSEPCPEGDSMSPVS